MYTDVIDDLMFRYAAMHRYVNVVKYVVYRYADVMNDVLYR